MLLENIKDVCNEKTITVAELERMCGFSSNTIRRWDISTPSIDKVATVAKVLHTTIDSLIHTEIKNKTTIIIDNRIEQLNDKQQAYLQNLINSTIDILTNN